MAEDNSHSPQGKTLGDCISEGGVKGKSFVGELSCDEEENLGGSHKFRLVYEVRGLIAETEHHYSPSFGNIGGGTYSTKYLALQVVFDSPKGYRKCSYHAINAAEHLSDPETIPVKLIQERAERNFMRGISIEQGEIESDLAGRP